MVVRVDKVPNRNEQQQDEGQSMQQEEFISSEEAADEDFWRKKQKLTGGKVNANGICEKGGWEVTGVELSGVSNGGKNCENFRDNWLDEERHRSRSIVVRRESGDKATSTDNDCSEFSEAENENVKAETIHYESNGCLELNEEEDDEEEEEIENVNGWIKKNVVAPQVQQQETHSDDNNDHAIQKFMPNLNKTAIGEVNVVNSKHVNFGDRNFYKGPVTIKQFVYTNAYPIQEKDKVPINNNINVAYNGRMSDVELNEVPRVKGDQAVLHPFGDYSSDVWVDSVRFIERNEWLAQPPTESLSKLEEVPVPYVIISHTASAPCVLQSECVQRVRRIQSFHIEGNGWSDIGYNFLVGGDGLAYVGRGWDAEGAHAFGWNKKSIVAQCFWSWRCGLVLCLIALASVTTIGIVSVGLSKSDETEDTPGTDTLRFVQRNDWLAQPPQDLPTKLSKLPAPYVIISHTATESCNTMSDCKLRVRTIQTYHVESQNFSDIAYNFLVGGDGFVYVGRDWDIEGAHAHGWNDKSIGLSFIGTFNDIPPNKLQLQGAIKLLELGVELDKLMVNYTLLGHRQVSKTLSPGQKLFDIITSWKHWSNKSYALAEQ
ncbi:peptidoglycan-recognition protein LE-like isoform X2 [Venturia canescens]|uniref:peptidoglycan-recognition protein LE-like isoform X2 n=1 Tax=Venturia canescens TaxID=32260 RepID=UPI001C9C201D|nr:peptidoglycan-recognition protein LE-like isoform X2 [Venturia canescens]